MVIVQIQIARHFSSKIKQILSKNKNRKTKLYRISIGHLYIIVNMLRKLAKSS